MESCHLVMRHLVRGECVALPTEIGPVLAASALDPQAVGRLRQVGRAALAISDYAELADWLPLLRGAALRVVRKLGAGPMVLEADADAGARRGLWQRLPEAARNLLAADGRIAVRWPDHPIWSELRAYGLPLAIAALPAGSSALAQAACAIDAGPMEIAAPTVVRAVGRRLMVQSAGVLAAEQIAELALCRIVFICTGNTCRSPMAQALCSRLLADALGCPVSELRQHGYCVQSAGLAAMMGSEASPDAVTVISEMGAELKEHSSRMVTRELLEGADFLFGMTEGHCYTLESIPLRMPAPRMLTLDGTDIGDPIGGAFADYKTCAQQILECLKRRLPEFLEA